MGRGSRLEDGGKKRQPRVESGRGRRRLVAASAAGLGGSWGDGYGVEGLEAEMITGVCNHPVLLACKILGGLVTFAPRNRDKSGTK
jgi:hypothetical protein